MLFIYDDTTIKWEDEEKQFCLHIHADETAESPRTAFDSSTKMPCFHPRYSLGDESEVNKGETPLEYMQRLVRNNIEESEIISAALEGRLGSVRMEKCKGEEELYNVYVVSAMDTIFGRSEPSENLEAEKVSLGSSVYYILDVLTFNDCKTLLRPCAEILPLWLYDHSGLTMSCGERNYPYNDQWDSCQTGWIIYFKEDVLKERYADETNWREQAHDYMKYEVKLYDEWLRGEVFGYTLYERKSTEEEWQEIDSCWGFYGSDPVENGMADNVGHGLANAIEKNSYKDGTAQYKVEKHVIL